MCRTPISHHPGLATSPNFGLRDCSVIHVPEEGPTNPGTLYHSLVKATKLLARFGSGPPLVKPLASSGGELTLPKLLANVRGTSAWD